MVYLVNYLIKVNLLKLKNYIKIKKNLMIDFILEIQRHGDQNEIVLKNLIYQNL
jgi:hypothetical protein